MKAKSPDWRASLAAMPLGGIAVFQSASGPLAARRVARSLLEEAAVLGGGQVIAFPGGDLLLGSTAAPGQRAALAIGRLTGAEPAAWPLPLGGAAVAACCEAASLAPATPTWNIAALEAHCAQWPLEEAARLTVFHGGPGSTPAAQRLGPAPLRLDDPDLEAMGRELLCRRILAALTNPSERARLPGLRPGLRLILDLPLGGLPQGAPMRAGTANDPNGPIALLPLASLSDPVGFNRILEGLRQGGWAVGLLAEHPAALDWVAAPDLIWAVPAGPAPPVQRPGLLIALGKPSPAWCRADDILHEGEA